jgi:hypothetical protein
VFALGLRLGVPVWVAPLVAPAVDLSVVALLLGSRQLAVNGAPVEVLRAARRLLIFASVVTLALNIADPLIAGRYGKAAFDAVGPLLLIGWAETGPGLLYAMQATTTGRNPTAARAANSSPPTGDNGRQPASASADEPVGEGAAVSDALSREAAREARRQDLLHRARAEDVLHWQVSQRPISAESLRKKLRVGAGTARGLVAQLRSDTHVTLDGRGNPSAP